MPEFILYLHDIIVIFSGREICSKKQELEKWRILFNGEGRIADYS